MEWDKHLPRPLPPTRPPPTIPPLTLLQSPQPKKQRLNLPSPIHSRNNKNHKKSGILPPPNRRLKRSSSPSKMDMQAMDIHIRQRLNSLDALVRDQIADLSSSDEFDDDTEEAESKSKSKEEEKHNDLSIEQDKLIALVNSGSGARKGWILAAELRKLDCIVYHLRDLSVSEPIREQLGRQLVTYQNKCLVLICGGDGSNAWAASIIDKCIACVPQPIPFPPTCVFPMGTGNDLSRCLGWGSLEPNHKNLLQCIADIHFAAKITKRWSDLDRWRCTYTFDHISDKTPQHIDTKDANQYEITPPTQFYRQQHPDTSIFKHIAKYDPPLPSTFICYLSIGYDALVAYNFERERRSHPERFNNQIKNQVMYVKHGFTEFFKPSEPITDFVDVIIDGHEDVALPENCRSLKLININSAMNGVFFWGAGKSRDFEYQQQSVPRLDDGKIEVMATRGVHDMIQHRVNVSHAQRISQCNDIIVRFKAIPKTGIALQIDGEAWIIRHQCTMRIQVHDKLPVVIGYNQPRGVRPWLMASLDDAHIVKAKESFRERVKRQYSAEGTPEDSRYSTSGSEQDKDKNVFSNSLMQLFNTVQTPKPMEKEKEKNPDLFEKMAELFQPKSKAEEEFKNEETPRTEMGEQEDHHDQPDDVEQSEDEIDCDQIDFGQYLASNPSILDNKNDILQSSVFDKSNHKDGLFLDRFAWWKVTRAKNHNKPIDAETATDAISNYHSNIEMRRTQSSMVLPRKGRSASLF
eukprot:68359_1